MFVYIKSSDDLNFCIDNDLILIKERSIGVMIKRSDGVMLPMFIFLDIRRTEKSL